MIDRDVPRGAVNAALDRITHTTGLGHIEWPATVAEEAVAAALPALRDQWAGECAAEFQVLRDQLRRQADELDVVRGQRDALAAHTVMGVELR